MKEMNLKLKILVLLTVFYTVAFGQNSSKFSGAITTQPAKRWEEAMLTGNGVMGAMMYGRPEHEEIVVNHCELFLTLGTKEFVKDLSGVMPEIKQAALNAGKDGPTVAHKMMLEMADQKISWTDPFHPAFSLHLDGYTPSGEISNYQLSENFSTGELKTSWSDDLGDWERKMFISRPDNVVAIEISGPKGKVNGNFSMKLEHELINVDMIAKGNEIRTHVTYVKGKGGYDNIIRVIPDGGTLSTKGQNIVVSGADKILVLMQVEPWRTPLPESQSEAWAFSPKNPAFSNGYIKDKMPVIDEHLDQLPVNYKHLLKEHVKIHGELFSRVNLELGENTATTSQQMLSKAAEKGEITPEMTKKLYDACRYLIICSTGKNPANLQGIWTGTWTPEWSGDYTLDSNIQLEIQSLMSCNMPELMEGYFTLIESWIKDCQLNATKLFGCRGIVSNPRASNTPLYLHWGRWPGEQAIGTMGWMLHFFYDYYQFTGDKVFLEKRVVPLLKESALFYEDLLRDTEDENGKYRFFLSYSPEQDHKLYTNSTFDIAVAKAVLTYLVKSCKTLDIENDNIAKWEGMLSKLPQYLINDKGELMEWAYPGTTENYNQRHHSHMLPLYQFCEFDQESDPVMWKASEKAFEGKEHGFLKNMKNPDSNHITHGLMNQAQCAARLGRADIVHEVLSRLMTKGYVFPGFMISYWPGHKGFGFDPVGTVPDVINNSLAFAWERKIDILPALPKEWDNGSIENVLLRGQITLKKLSWNLEKKQVSVKLESAIEQEVEIRLPEKLTLKSIEINGKQYSIETNKVKLKLYPPLGGSVI